MKQRDVLHSDLNCFYASVEMLLDPSLRGKAVAVCGSTEDRHGIVLAKSELAKRAGVKTGMVNWEARQCCPDLVVVPPQYDEYLKFSALTRAIYGRFTDQVEPYGMDECWLDVTESHYMFGSSMDIAESIRKSTREELGLTVSIGVSYNKIFAKLGSDMKKPDAITEITPEDMVNKVWPLPAGDLLYVGRATNAKLSRYGIHTIGEIAQTDPRFLQRLLGINGLAIWSYAAGLDCSRVMHRDFVSPVKSVGHGITCNADLESEEEVYRVLLELAQDVGHRLRVHDLSARGVQIQVRGNDLLGQQYQCQLEMKTQLPQEIANAGFKMFQERYNWSNKVRADLFVDTERLAKKERLQDAIEDCHRRFGKRSITYATLLGNLKMADDGRDKVRMPGAMYV